MRSVVALALASMLTACATGPAAGTTAADVAAMERRVVLPSSVLQGALVFGQVPAGSEARYAGRVLRATPDGRVVFGVGRDQLAPVQVTVRRADGSSEAITVAVTPRDWPLERIDGVPPDTLHPPPDVAARIEREQARVAAVRTRDDARTDFAQGFIWPVQGRVSGRFGDRRTYTLPDGTLPDGSGTPKPPHSGVDIAAIAGTPVRAPAAGVITFADPGLYLTGGTVLLDHGHGVSSSFLHLSRIDVAVGDRIAQGQVIGAVGATGRAAGPHLHWGMNWFDVRIDPQLVLERGGDPAAAPGGP